MLCSSESLYPNDIDESFFFQDTNIDNIEILNTFQSYIAQGKYTDARDYINSQEGISGAFACYLNAYENRIHALQQHLQGKTKTNPHHFDRFLPPVDIADGEFWLGGGDPTGKYVLDLEGATLDGTTLVITDDNCSADVENKIITLNCDDDTYEAIEKYS